MNLDKFLGCTFGLAIGDALGVPFEKMTGCEIRNILEGPVRKFESPALNTHESSDFHGAPEGAISDDTLRFKGTMRGILKAYSNRDTAKVTFSQAMDCIAECLVEEVRASKRGWGKGTLAGAKSLGAGAHWSKSGAPDRAGNGPMPGVVPFGLWASVIPDSPRDFREKCMVYAKMTHLGTPAIVATVVHAFAVASLAGNQRQSVHVQTLLYFLYKIAVETEERLPDWKDRISDMIKNVWEYIEYGRAGRIAKQQTPEKIASLFFGGTSYAPCSLGLSYAIFFKSCLNPDNPDPFQAVFDAVNAGGDTDSNAAIVGSLVGALHGFKKAIPIDLARDVEGSGKLRKLTTQFYYTCDRVRQSKSVR